MNRMMLMTFCMFMLLPANSGYAENASDYLVLENIEPYKISRPEKLIPGFQPIGGPRVYDNWVGVISATGHFSKDHVDKTYKIMYLGGEGLPSPTVEVTQHAGTDSDKWLLHEVDMYFRNYYGIPGRSYIVRKIDGNTIIAYGAGGWAYRWLSDNKVIHIAYTDLQMTKPEPLEVVKAYLAKHPSTLPSTITATVQKSLEGKTTWIKDEMDRRLWLCDKWLQQLQAGKTDIKTTLEELVDHMDVFLDYREKYYGMKATKEKRSLWEYLQAKDGTGIKNKLAEYKTWWTANKDKPISL